MLKKIKNDLELPDSIFTSLQKLANDFRIEGYPPKGANGYLFFATNSILKTKVAIKYYYWGNDLEYHAEPQILALCKSANILPIHHAECVCDEWALFITDYCSKGDLEDFIKKENISTKKALEIIICLLNGLSCLHAQQLLHRDLKPQNILINNSNKPVIGDFGSVKKIPDGESKIPASGHSLIFRPPESITNNFYSVEGDLYQIGVIFYLLLGGKLSMDELSYLNNKEIKQYNKIDSAPDKSLFIDTIIKNKITKGKLIDFSKLPPWTDARIVKLLKKVINVNPNKRYKACSVLMNDIVKIKRNCLDWIFNDDCLKVKQNNKEFRIIKSLKDEYFLEKRKHSNWRRDNTLPPTNDINKFINLLTKKLQK